MNELKELEDLIYDISEDWIDTDDGDEYAHHLNDTQLKQIMQLIESFTAKKELEARIDELKNIKRFECTDCEFISVKQIINPRITQLTSQLTNNKEDK